MSTPVKRKERNRVSKVGASTLEAKSRELLNRIQYLYLFLRRQDTYQGLSPPPVMDTLREEIESYSIVVDEKKLEELKSEYELGGKWKLQFEILTDKETGRKALNGINLLERVENGFVSKTIPVQPYSTEKTFQGRIDGKVLYSLAILLNSKGIERGVVERLIDALPFHDEVKNAIYWIAENAKRELENRGLPVDPFTDLFKVSLYESFGLLSPFISFTHGTINVLDYVTRDKDGKLFWIGLTYSSSALSRKGQGEPFSAFTVLSMFPLSKEKIEEEGGLVYNSWVFLFKLVGIKGTSIIYLFRRDKFPLVYVLDHERVPRKELFHEIVLESIPPAFMYSLLKMYGRPIPPEDGLKLLEDVLWRAEALHHATAVYAELTVQALEHLRNALGDDKVIIRRQ